MRFKKRILISYIIVLLTVSIVGGAAVIYLLIHQYAHDEYTTMETLAQQTVSQFDAQITMMQAAMDNVLSDADTLNSIRYLANNTEDDERHKEYEDKIKVHLNQWFYVNNFYRVLFYNDSGERISSEIHSKNQKNNIRSDFALTELAWLDSVRGRNGKPKLIPLRTDEWGNKEGVKVISLVKEVQGTNMGFLEVQMSESTLNNMLTGIEENYAIYIYYEDEEFFHSSGSERNPWKDAYIQNSTGIQRCTNLLTGKKEIVCVSGKSKKGITVVLTEGTSIVWEKASYYVLFTVIVIIMLLAVFLLYVAYISDKLSQPVIKLRKQIEQMNYLQEDGHFRLDERSDELGCFGDAFNQMVNTINELLLKDVEAEIQIQRSRVEKRELQLMYLRSQINPHFLYNTLETIRMKAICGEKEDVAVMIEMLIQFFRKGLEQSEQITTIKEEIEMIRAYTGIMSFRYCEIDTVFKLDESLLNEIIPCFVLQPLVENCFLHGLKKKCYCGKIEIMLYRKEDGLICISIQNEGERITQEELEKIRNCLENENRNAPGSEKKRHIGLNNINARMKLYYPDENCGLFFYAVPEGGLRVEIRIRGCLPVITGKER